ncbi:MAG: hypothetical protein HQL36_04725 [Alphaproteobacteria bacterium]|nr:hypothetical protein [Alphaproteobacteria bacterium]
MAGVAWTALDARLRADEAAIRQGERARLARVLELTDLALFTEARYTRHVSQSDLHSAFQDHPMSLDHFPSGSLIGARRIHPGAGSIIGEQP